MKIYRLTRENYKNDLSGKGAELAGGRWNPKGMPALYAAESRSLAILETIVHTPISLILDDFVFLILELPDEFPIFEISEKQLSSTWKVDEKQTETKGLGEALLVEQHFLGFRVPSVVVPQESNFVFNPRHPDFSAIKIIEIEPFEFDERLLNL